MRRGCVDMGMDMGMGNGRGNVRDEGCQDRCRVAAADGDRDEDRDEDKDEDEAAVAKAECTGSAMHPYGSMMISTNLLTLCGSTTNGDLPRNHVHHWGMDLVCSALVMS